MDDNTTVLNEELLQSNLTVLNTELLADEPDLPTDTQERIGFLEEGSIICDKYVVKNRLEYKSGEADLYICTDGEAQYVAKLYKRKTAIKETVMQLLRSIDSAYVASIIAFGRHAGFPVEILPYYKNGNMLGKHWSESEIIEMVIPCINEGLKALHEKGIIHKDLKPSNLMISDDEKSVAIIDFGISSATDEGNTVLVTQTGMTPEYSAPETFKNLFLVESDYYSFGVTVFELYCGYTPYANMSQEEIEQYVSVQRIPFPEDMPEKLRDFISALTYYDITNRKNKENPNRRWTYDEVKRWCDGESIVIPGEGVGNPDDIIPEYLFMNVPYTEIRQLVAAIARNWEEGKRQLFRGEFTKYFQSFNHKLAVHCCDAETEAQNSNGKDDIIFWKLLYRLDPTLKAFYWKGRNYESLPAFGRDVLDRLWQKDSSMKSYYESILQENLLSAYMEITSSQNGQLAKAVTAIEEQYQIDATDRADMQKVLFMMAYLLSGQKLLYLSEQYFRTVGEFSNYMRVLLEQSFEQFQMICHSLVDYDGNLDVQLETWLITIGKQKELEQWRAALLA